MVDALLAFPARLVTKHIGRVRATVNDHGLFAKKRCTQRRGLVIHAPKSCVCTLSRKHADQLLTIINADHHPTPLQQKQPGCTPVKYGLKTVKKYRMHGPSIFFVAPYVLALSAAPGRCSRKLSSPARLRQQVDLGGRREGT